MGQNSAIEWTDHTFNPWWGCEKVSPACAHCYAETFSRRVGFVGAPVAVGDPEQSAKPRLWGPGSERRMFGDKHWNEPLKWNRNAARDGARLRVFCASMADVFEDRPELVAARARLYKLIDATPHLDWLLLTKRPENADRLWFDSRASDDDIADGIWQRNVWLGTTVEDQRRADERIPHLLAVPARVRFLSVEPMLGPVDLTEIVTGRGTDAETHQSAFYDPDDETENPGINWVIVGGESGPGARPMHPQWARDVRDQCVAAGVAFLFKQWGEHLPIGQEPMDALLPADPNADGGPSWRRVGKKLAGRELDGRTWDEFPMVVSR